MLNSFIQEEMELIGRPERAATHVPTRRYYMALSSVQEEVISYVYKLGSQGKESCCKTSTQIVSFFFSFFGPSVHAMLNKGDKNVAL